MEYRTDAPVGVGLRAWSPFIPGDIEASNTPGAVFEVRLRNMTQQEQSGTLALNFPGPTEGEAGTTAFDRREVDEDGFQGLSVESEQASYALGVIGPEKLRLGGELGVDETAWATMEHELPYAVSQSGATAAVDFSLAAGEEKVVRYVLAWYCPEWMGGGTMTAGGNAYTHMYASRYDGAVAAARYLATNHESLLRRVLAWQAAVYQDPDTPAWLKDALINFLHLITETSVWAQAKDPVGDWCRPEDGVFGMCECPRACPQIECIPCSFYGNIPLVYFYPELAMSTLRAYKAYQYPDGAAPWVFGGSTVGSKPYEMALPSPGYSDRPQTTLDGPCYVDMVDRMWSRTGDEALLREFYESVKKNTAFTMGLRPGSGAAGIVSMPTDNMGQDWFEFCDLYGIVPHVGGAHLAQLRMAARMADAVGDPEFARQCREWIEQGSAVMEEHAWAGSHYMLFNELETGQQSDVVMGYQLDGEWMALSHGLEGVFRSDRVDTTLETIKNTSATMSEHGAVVFCLPGAQALGAGDWDPGYWGSHGIHPPGAFMLAMTYMYRDQREFGLELARRTVQEFVNRGLYWNAPVVLDPGPGGWDQDVGESMDPDADVVAGIDYYQNMMLWSLPAAMQGKDLMGPVSSGGLVDRVLKAGAR